ncbi:MAG: hypothetical protein J5643_07315 [Lachnospiraceae bacterium]|nr:hypothetical protein [Lachnospiraceae bacterium]
MMRSEFIERTGYKPVIEYSENGYFIKFDEYYYIEESYYEYNGNKDEFCAAWKKAYKSGAWATELKLRKRINEQNAEHAAKIAEMEDTISFYQKHFDKGMEAQKKVKELEDKLARIQRIINQ